MSKLSALDLSFLIMESQVRPMHMACCIIYDACAERQEKFVPRVLDVFRSSEVGKPFNQQLKWLNGSLAKWEEVAQLDMNYHIKHVALPAPGTAAQLDELLSVLNPPLLDRTRPLWQCFVIEGLENGQFAVFFKLHHSMIDGMGGIKALHNALSLDPEDEEIRPIWLPVGESAKSEKGSSSRFNLSQLAAKVSALPSGVRGFVSELSGVGVEALKGSSGAVQLPYQAPETPFNIKVASSARTYGNCEISLERVKAISKATGCTVNDIMMTCIDDSVHKYLTEHGHKLEQPLVSSIAISARAEGQGAGGNRVSADLLPMGQPEATLKERLAQINESTSKVKEKVQNMSLSMRQFYSMALIASSIPEMAPGVAVAPSYNLIISNMAGPREQLYMGGAPVKALYGLPIVPPTPALNISFVGWNDQICLGVASVPEAMPDPARYIQLLQQSFSELEKATLPKKAAPRKKAVPRKKPAKKSTGGSQRTGKQVA